MLPLNLLLSLLLLYPSLTSSLSLTHNASSPFIAYEGRWDKSTLPSGYRTDWPCARVTFGVEGEGKVRVSWAGIRVRLNFTVWGEGGDVVGSDIVKAKYAGREVGEEVTEVDIPKGGKTVTVRRLTEGANYGAGIGMKLLTSSMMVFHGLDVEGGVKVGKAERRDKVIEYIGASDTAGYCVDGDTEIDGTAKLYLNGWEYDNCDAATPALLGEERRQRACLMGRSLEHANPPARHLRLHFQR